MLGTLNDLRHGWRGFRRQPGFTAAAILTIALGVAATTTVFSAVEAAILRPWPFPGADRIVVPRTVDQSNGRSFTSVNYGDFEDWQADDLFEAVAVYRVTGLDLAGGTGDPIRVDATVVSPDYFQVLGTGPSLGRTFAAEEYLPGGLAVLLSHGIWQTHFGGDDNVVGASVDLDGRTATIVGVLPTAFELLPGEIYIPMQVPESGLAAWRDRDNFAFLSFARLRPGQTPSAAEAALGAVAARIEADHPQLRQGITADLVPLGDFLVGSDTRNMLFVLLGAVGFVLLIGCANLANLLLARAAGRARELATRSAMGATRLRIVRQLMVESLMLGAAGGTLGVALATGGMRGLSALAPGLALRMDTMALNGTVLAFGLAVTVSSALLFGLLPALRVSAAQTSAAMADAAFGSTAGSGGGFTRGALVLAELALAVVLLAGAGLMVRSLDHLRSVDPGFRVDDMVTFRVTLPSARYEGRERLQAGLEELATRIEALPGVESVTLTNVVPLGGGGFQIHRAYLPEGRPEPPVGTEVRAMWDAVRPGYFRTLELPLVAGRGFSGADDADGEKVMVMNRAMALDMFGSVDGALGKRVRSWRDENVYRRVVGVVEDVRYFGVADAGRGVAYVPHAQSPFRTVRVMARTHGDPSAQVAAIRAAGREFDPHLALASFQSVREVFRRSMASQLFVGELLSLFAGIAVVLAALGIYGVLAFVVAARTREIGVRMALGAGAGHIRLLVARQVAPWFAAGVGLGLLGALALSRVLAGMLHEVEATDPLTWASVLAVLTTVAGAATLVPARRASRVEPARAMRPD